MSGTQSNTSLIERTKVDWCLLLSPLGIEDYIDEVTSLYSKEHNFLIKSTLSGSKVMAHLEKDKGKLPSQKIKIRNSK